jgi:hypothetical protein
MSDRPYYLRLVVDNSTDDRCDGREIVALAPPRSAKAIIAVCTAPYADAGRRALDAAMDAIRYETCYLGLDVAFGDDMSAELADLIMRRIQSWIVRRITARCEGSDA